MLVPKVTKNSQRCVSILSMPCVFDSCLLNFPVGDSPLFGWADSVPYGETFLAVGGNQLTGDTGPETQLTTIYIFNKVQTLTKHYARKHLINKHLHFKADYSWELLDERLTYAREAPAAFLVGRSIFPEYA